MLLKSTSSSDNNKLQANILPAFGFKEADHPAFYKLLSVVDQSGVLTVTPEPAPDWIKETDGTVRKPLQLPPGSDGTSRKLTNAVWCINSPPMLTVDIATTYTVSLGTDDVLRWLSANLDGLLPTDWAGSNKPQNLQIGMTLRRTASYPQNWTGTGPNDLPPMISPEVNIVFHLRNFDLHFHFDGTAVMALLVPTGSGSIAAMISGAFSNDTGDSDVLPSSTDSSDTSIFQKVFKNVYLWHVGMMLTRTPSATFKAGTSLSWNFGLLAALKLGTNASGGSENAVVAFIYDEASKTFTGQLLTKSSLIQQSHVRTSLWDPRIDPIATLKSKQLWDGLTDGIDLLHLIGIDSSDSPFPLVLTEAQVSFTRGSGGTGSVLYIHGAFSSAASLSNSNVHVPFEWSSAAIDVMVTRGTATAYSIRLSNVFLLTGKTLPGETTPPQAVFSILLQYEKVAQASQWSISATARNLSVKLIASFMNADVQDGAMAVLGKLNLSLLSVNYTFAASQASSFTMAGILKLGDLELDLTYSSVSSGQNDSMGDFKAVLGSGSPNSTIASIAESIVTGAKDKLPDFVGSIPVSAASNPGAAPICLLEVRSDKNADGRATLLTVWLAIGGLSFTFMQFRTRAKVSTDSVVKRYLRISVDQIPMMDKIPIVGNMPQPFDHLEYVWAEDDNSKLTGDAAVDPTRLGFTQSDLDSINKLQPKEIPPIQVKGSAPSNSGSGSTVPPDNKSPVQSKPTTPADIKLAHGHHFIVVVRGQVVLDHVFVTSKADSQPDSTNESHKVARTASKETEVPAVPEARPTKGSTTTAAGPLTISALTLQYKKGHLIVTVDATLKLGPLVLSVIGFQLDLNLSGVKLDHLADIVTHGLIEASLHGMEVGVTQGALTLKGVFIHDKTATGESYRGGIAVGFKAWQILAIGEYFVHFNAAGQEDYKAVFVYGKLDGPLIELEFVTISGVRVGFGYNYAIRMPGLQELTSFPLISDKGTSGNGTGNDPAAILEAFRGGTNPFVYVKKGSGWFAAGMTITAFDLLTLTAVLVADIDSGESDPNEKGVILAMFADGVFQMEPLVDPNLALFYIELVIKVELNFVHGYIAADAALAPASHIWVPEAHLTGQASFYLWFGDNPHAGDWVASIGGYSRSYEPAAWYPRPARFGLSFTVGDNIQMIGQAYCAVTPKCAMAGGTLHLSLSVGPVSAYADLIIDAFINFKPFHFRAEISLSVGIECDIGKLCFLNYDHDCSRIANPIIDLLFVHFHVSMSLGADLVVWGPHDFGGRAHVHFWFFGFDISFGADENPSAKNPIMLAEFVEMVIKPGPASSAPPTDAVGTTGGPSTRHKYSVEDGLAPQVVPQADANNNFPSTGANSEWHVLAGTLSIRIDCGFALTQAFLEQLPGTPEKEIFLPNKQATPPVYSWPMHSNASQNFASVLRITITKVVNQEIQDHFKPELVLKTASKALWSVWDAKLDPLHADDKPDHLKDATDATVPLVQAVRIKPPDPMRARSKIIDFDAAAAMKFTIPFQPVLPEGEVEARDLGCEYFESVDGTGQRVPGVQRWLDFRDMWQASASTAAVVAAKGSEEDQGTVDMRQAVTELIADVCEWQIRPPVQMAKHTPSAPVPPAGGNSNLPSMRTGVPNAPRVLEDGRTDWQLMAVQPSMMVGLLDIYYPSLPYVCG